MFGQDMLFHRFISVADEEEPSKAIADFTGRHTSVLMHLDVFKYVKGIVKSSLKCRLQEVGTSIEFFKRIA